MKKLFPLFILLILVSFLPSIKAETESLYVDSKTNDLQNWDERNEPSPYLADEITGYVHEVKSSGATEGYFGFADPSGTGTINNVYLYMECYGEDTNDLIHIYVDCSDGSGWVNEGTIYVNQLSYDWEILFITTRLDSWPDIQNAQIYLFYQGVGGGDDIFVRQAFLYVDYTPSGGTEYTREVSQAISWTGTSYRSWDTSRTLIQSTTLATTGSRNWDSLRTLSQEISLSLSTYTVHFEYFLRSLTLSLNLATESFRTWDLSRLLSQGLAITSGSLRSWTLSRTLTQGLSFLSSAFGQITTGAEQILRTITMSLSLTTESIRSWTLSRTLSQGITIINNAIGQKLLGGLIKRVLTLSLSLASNIDLTMRIVNEFNFAYIAVVSLGIIFTVIYFLYDKHYQVGILAFGSWFVSAAMNQYLQPDLYPISFFFAGLALMHVLLLMMDYAGARKVDFWN